MLGISGTPLPTPSDPVARVLLHLHDLGLGGAERIALQWAVWLTEEGHEVTLLLGRAASDAFYSLPEGLPCIRRPTTSADPRSWLPTWWWLRAWLRRHPPDLAIGVTTRLRTGTPRRGTDGASAGVRDVSGSR